MPAPATTYSPIYRGRDEPGHDIPRNASPSFQKTFGDRALSLGRAPFSKAAHWPLHAHASSSRSPCFCHFRGC